MDGKCIFLDNAIVEHMLLEDAFDHFWSCAVIPDAIRVDDQDRPLLADAQAIGFGAEDGTGALFGGAIKSQFLQPFLEIVPGNQAGLLVTTFWDSSIGADEEMALDAWNAQGFDGGVEGCVICHGGRSRRGWIRTEHIESRSFTFIVPSFGAFLSVLKGGKNGLRLSREAATSDMHQISGVWP